MGMMLPARFMIGMLEEMIGKDFETSLAGLKERCEKATAAAPTEVAAGEPIEEAAKADPATAD